MRNKQSIKLFIILFLCTFFIFSFSHFGASVFQAMINNDNSLSEGTMVGGVDVSGKSENEAIQKVDEQLTEWLETTNMQLHFKEKSILLDNALFRFEISESVTTASIGQKNEVLVHIDNDAFEESMRQNFPSVNKNDLDIEKLHYALLKNAKMLESGKFDISLEDYLYTENLVKNELISESIIQLENSSSALTRLTSKVRKIEIPLESQFSLVNFIIENGLKSESPTLHNALASGIYELVLPTNFSIIERHISNEKPDYAKLGFEAKVDIEKNMDLIFTNMNQTSYFIELKQNGDSLLLSLTGPSFLNKYAIYTKDEQTFKPKTIKHFNPLLKKGQKTVEKEGKDGLLISVFREVYDEKGKLLKKESISEDFYPPIPQIEVYALIEKEAAQPATKFELDSEKDESVNTDENINSDESNVAEQENNGIIDSDNELWGKKKEQMK